MDSIDSLILVRSIVDNYTFERIKDLSDDLFYTDMTYDHFIAWNKKCIGEMDTDDLKCVIYFCKLIKNNSIHIVDEETCCEMQACSIYFNKNKKLCIVNPR